MALIGQNHGSELRREEVGGNSSLGRFLEELLPSFF
jgi:hypothetical protein